jgi:hypothetical protein
MSTIWNQIKYTGGIWQADSRVGSKSKSWNLPQHRSQKYQEWPIRKIFVMCWKLDHHQALSKQEKECWLWLREEKIVFDRPRLPEFKPTVVVRKKDLAGVSESQ